MITVRTQNSTYRFDDTGDGAFWMTSDNPRYTDFAVTFYRRAIVGMPMTLRRVMPVEGRGNSFVTSPVVSIFSARF